MDIKSLYSVVDGILKVIDTKYFIVHTLTRYCCAQLSRQIENGLVFLADQVATSNCSTSNFIWDIFALATHYLCQYIRSVFGVLRFTTLTALFFRPTGHQLTLR